MSLNSEVPFRVLVLTGVAYGCYLLYGVSRMLIAQSGLNSCQLATMESMQSETNGATLPQRQHLKETADKACRYLCEVAR